MNMKTYAAALFALSLPALASAQNPRHCTFEYKDGGKDVPAVVAVAPIGSMGSTVTVRKRQPNDSSVPERAYETSHDFLTFGFYGNGGLGSDPKDYVFDNVTGKYVGAKDLTDFQKTVFKSAMNACPAKK
jgi:hypothetical protein